MMPFEAMRLRAAQGDVWRKVGPFTGSSDSAGWSGYTARNKIQSPPAFGNANLGPSSKIRLLLRAANAGSALQVSALYVGLQATSGNPYDFAAAPVQALFSGSASVTIPTNTAVWTDPVVLAIPLSRAIVTSAYLTGGDMRLFNYVDAGNRRFFRTGNDASSVVGSGSYTESASGVIYMIEDIEVA